MSELKPAVDMSFGEFIKAKVDARMEAVNQWLDVPGNQEDVVFWATVGSATLAAGIEVAADIVAKREVPNAKLKSAGLHVLAVATAAETLVSAAVSGSLSGENSTKRRHHIK